MLYTLGYDPNCTENIPFINGHIVTSDNAPLKGVKLQYGISSSGYDNFVAESENQTFSVPVAWSDTNIVRIIKLKNGVGRPEDLKIFVPKDNNIELSFEY